MKPYTGLRRAAMVIMYILAAGQVLSAILFMYIEPLTPGGMAWNWIWAALGLLAAILLSVRHSGPVRAGAVIALLSGILLLVSNLFVFVTLLLAGTELVQEAAADLLGPIDAMVFGIVLAMILCSVLYFIVFGMGSTAAKRMKAAQAGITAQPQPKIYASRPQTAKPYPPTPQEAPIQPPEAWAQPIPPDAAVTVDTEVPLDMADIHIDTEIPLDTEIPFASLAEDIQVGSLDESVPAEGPPVTCPKCGNLNPTDAMYCMRCGERLVQF